MKTTSTLMTAAAALTLGLSGAAFAEDAPGAKSDIMIALEESSPGSDVSPSGDMENEGALVAPEKDAMDGNEATGGNTDKSAANVPGTDADGDAQNENQGALSAPEKDAMGTDMPTGGDTDESAANVPGTDAEGDPANENQGALAAPEKDTKEM